MSALPAAYRPETAFGQHSVSSPATPLPGHKLDGEFAAIRLAIAETQARLKELQNDDGTLGNESVHLEALSLRVRQLLISKARPVGFWEAAQHYHQSDYVEHQGGGYLSLDAHTSGSDFAVDRAHGHWLIVTGAGTNTLTGNFCPSAWSELFVRANSAAQARSTLRLGDAAGEGLSYDYPAEELRVSVSELEPATQPFDTSLQLIVEDDAKKPLRMTLAQLCTVIAGASGRSSRRPNGIYREFNH